MKDELYCFDSLKEFLHVKGIAVKEPYMPIDTDDVEWYKGGKHLEFEKDGIYLVKRNGGKQKVFLYQKAFYREKPHFHVFDCPKIHNEYIGKIFFCANVGTVPVIRDKIHQEMASDLPICGYCAEKAELSSKYNTTSYIQLIRHGRSIHDVHVNENLFEYSDDWQDVKEDYFRKCNNTCEFCKTKIDDFYEREKYLVIHHKNHLYDDNSPKNLCCLCLDCLSRVDRKSVWINGANKENLREFAQKYRKRLWEI